MSPWPSHCAFFRERTSNLGASGSQTPALLGRKPYTISPSSRFQFGETSTFVIRAVGLTMSIMIGRFVCTAEMLPAASRAVSRM